MLITYKYRLLTKCRDHERLATARVPLATVASPTLPPTPVPPTPTPAGTPVHLLSPLAIMRLVDQGKLAEKKAAAILAKRSAAAKKNSLPTSTPVPQITPLPTKEASPISKGTVNQMHLDGVERKIGELTNVERQSQGLNPLVWDEQLQGVARAHSQDMADHGFARKLTREPLA